MSKIPSETAQAIIAAANAKNNSAAAHIHANELAIIKERNEDAEFHALGKEIKAVAADVSLRIANEAAHKKVEERNAAGLAAINEAIAAQRK